jgi:N-acetylglucosamine-6-phosphate deacetylase
MRKSLDKKKKPMTTKRFLTLVLPITLVLISAKVVAQEQVTQIEGLLYLDHSPVSIEIRDGKIYQITRLKEVPENFPQVYIAPGFIDNQVNGYAGVSFAFGGSDLTTDGVLLATQALWKEGVTTYLPTLTTNDRSVLTRNFSVLKKAKDDPGMLGSIPGFHLEGPFISPEDGWRGAHPLQHVRKPDWEEFMDYYNASGRNILQVTLAPETEGALDFISLCREKNIIVALGHHNASSEIITAAIDRGAQIATHLGNGAANTINRHRNPFWPQLADDRLMISIIADGFHLLPEQIKVFSKVKGYNNTILTSDVTSFAGLPPGIFTTSEGVTIELTPEGMLRFPEQNVLYGSAAPITKGVGHVMKVTGCSLADAVQMASTNPAKLYGLNDRGEILKGKRADLIVFTIDNFKIEIQKTIVAGQVVYTGVK